jgi:predicted ATP-grasp superfamily ATP-dependent carboligase
VNLKASPETIRAVADALKLAAFLDDRVAQADAHRVAAWSEQIERHRLTPDDLLDGVQAFYDKPSDRPIGIGDLIHHARIVKRDRLDREEDAERDRRRAEQDDRVNDEIDAFMADAITSRVKDKTKRLTAAEEALQTCEGKHECQAAIKEFVGAKTEASRGMAAVRAAIERGGA